MVALSMAPASRATISAQLPSRCSSLKRASHSRSPLPRKWVKKNGAELVLPPVGLEQRRHQPGLVHGLANGDALCPWSPANRVSCSTRADCAAWGRASTPDGRATSAKSPVCGFEPVRVADHLHWRVHPVQLRVHRRIDQCLGNARNESRLIGAAAAFLQPEGLGEVVRMAACA